jgi:diguanylate cyclase (GGDEF)-like protein
MDIQSLARKLKQALKRPRVRLAVVIFHFGLFYLAFFLLHPSLGPVIGVFGIIPIIVAAWYFGMWAGALLAIGVYLVDNLITVALGWSSPAFALQATSLLGLTISITSTLIVGRLGEISSRRQAEIDRNRVELEDRNTAANFLALLNDILCAALEKEDLAAMLSELVDWTGKLFSADACYITFWDEKTRKTIPMSAYGPLHEVYTRVHRFMPEERTLTAVVMDTGRAVPIEDVKNSPLLTRNVAEEFPNRSALGLPLIAGEWKLGALILGYDKPRSFSTSEIERGELAARGISLAVTKALLLNESRQRLHELSGLHDLSQIFSMHGNDQLAFSQLTGTMARLMQVPVCLLCLREPAGASYRVQLPAFGLDNEQAQTLGCLLIPDDPQAPGAQGVHYLNQVQDFPADFAAAASLCGIENILVASLTEAGQEPLGSLLLANRPGGFGERDARQIGVFIRQVTIVIQNTLLLNSERKSADELAIIQAVADAAAAERDENHLIEKITRLIGDKLSSDNFGVLLADEKTGQLTLHASYQLGGHEMPIQVPPDKANAGLVARSGRPRRFNDATAGHNNISLHPQTRSGLCVPLRVEKSLLGVVNLESTRPNAFNDEDEELLTIIASQLASAIQRLRMQENEERQQVLLTRSNRMIKGLAEIGARAAAASDLDGIVQNLGNELGKLGQSCLIALAEEDGTGFRLRYTSLPTPVVLRVEALLGMQMGGFPISLEQLNPLDQPKTRASLIENIAPLAKNILPLPNNTRFEPLLDAIGATSGVSICHIPMLVEGRTIGILWVWGEGLHETDLPTMEVFGSQVAAAIHTAKLLDVVQQLAITDELTRLYNRRHFFELANQEFNRSQRYEKELAAMIIDIDHFKQFNDQYGHLVGDQVLRAVSQMLRDNLREVDILGRYGGEEFSVLLPSTNMAAAVLAAKRLHKHVAEVPVPTDAGPLSVKFSIGVSAMTGKEDSLQELINRADKAMYVAKNSGRNKLAVK